MDLQTQTASRGLVSGVVTPPFLVALLMLGLAAGLSRPVASWLRIKQGKQPLPLKAPLSVLDVEAIAPYRVLQRQVLEPAVVDALGTNMYLSWTLEDTSVPSNDPMRYATLFVSYYTGGHNLVPHRPDVCWLGSGYEQAQPHENMEIDVPSLRPGPTKVPIRVCTFARTALRNRTKESVIYTFNCNGGFVAGRTGVRLRLNKLTNTYAYFSKIEARFPKATRARNIEGVKKLFDKVLPVLVKDHWSDFEAAEEAARQTRPQATGYGLRSGA